MKREWEKEYPYIVEIEISIQVGLTINEHKTKYLRCTKKQHKMDGIDITQTHLEQVKSFKYLGSIVKGNNSIEEEIKRRISLGNKAFYANQDYLKVNYWLRIPSYGCIEH